MTVRPIIGKISPTFAHVGKNCRQREGQVPVWAAQDGGMTLILRRRARVLLLVTLLITGDCLAAKPNAVKHTKYGSTIENIDAPRTALTVKQARKALMQSLNQQIGGRTVRKVVFRQDRVEFTIVEKEGHTPSGAVIFAELKTLAVETGRFPPHTWGNVRANGKDLSLGPSHGAIFENRSTALLFVDAVLNLKAAPWVPDLDAADFAAFAAAAKQWSSARPHPEMPEEARTYKLVAEDAFRRKDFPGALDAYGEALDLFPMWPEGHYNAALLAAETEDYELAAQHMRRYLALVPDAKDASTAKDKLLLWQHKARN